MHECISPKQLKKLLQDASYQYLPLEKIRVGKKRLNRKKIDQIKTHLQKGGETSPIVISQMHDGSYRIVGDGRHRYTAHNELNLHSILCRLLTS